MPENRWGRAPFHFPALENLSGRLENQKPDAANKKTNTPDDMGRAVGRLNLNTNAVSPLHSLRPLGLTVGNGAFFRNIIERSCASFATSQSMRLWNSSGSRFFCCC
jgi:hypothetical protein